MRRTMFPIGLLCLVFLAVAAPSDEPRTASETRQAFQLKLQDLLATHGPNHPEVAALQRRIDQLAEPDPAITKKHLVVLAKENGSATLKEARIRTLAGRSFVVGISVDTEKITRSYFPGRTIWIPVDCVTQMIEVEARAAEK
jgi:hypothetical protein